MEKKVIFGAGKLGRRALLKYGSENILFIADNNKEFYKEKINGIEIKSPEALVGLAGKCKVIIASRQKESMIEQLNNLGIEDYEVYSEDVYFDIPEIVYNPYCDSTDKYVNKVGEAAKIKDINLQVKKMSNSKQKLFNHIEIETVNRCNGVCEFCPVNRNSDKREFKKMEEELFHSMINQLNRLNYAGRIALFSNNEPFLDDRIIEFHRYMRENLPNARTHLCTNGTLLSMDKFIEIMPYLDELIIDNYNNELKLIAPCREIVEYCEKHIELKKKVTVILRKTKEVLTSRGGDAPNAEHAERYPEASCMLPYKQMIVRPDGKVSLCCNDALGKCTLGDLNKESLEEVWFGHRFSKVREILSNGRKEFDRCRYCDTLFLC